MVELDELDLMLAKELELDGRQSNRVLAKRLARSQKTIKMRLQRLLDEGVITFATVSGVTKIINPVFVDIGLSVSPGKAYEVAEYLRPFRNVQGIILTTGRFDLLITTVFRDVGESITFLEKDLGPVPHLTSVETMLFVDAVKVSWQYLNPNNEQVPESMHHDIDELDIRLIRELELCPRISIKSLGEQLGINRRLASRRLQELLDKNIVRVVSLARPSFFGLNVQVFIFVKVLPGNIRSVANSLIIHGRVQHICIITGVFQILLNAAFQDMDELSNFLVNDLGNLEGVISHETMIQVKFTKRTYSRHMLFA